MAIVYCANCGKQEDILPTLVEKRYDQDGGLCMSCRLTNHEVSDKLLASIEGIDDIIKSTQSTPPKPHEPDAYDAETWNGNWPD